MKRAGAVFFTGGDQLRLTSQLGETPVFQAIQKLYHDGGVVAGTSAGASVLSDTMLVSGESGASPKGGDAIQMAPGFGLIEGVVRELFATSNYDGVLGTWSFDQDGDTTLTELSGQKVENGKFEFNRVIDIGGA